MKNEEFTNHKSQFAILHSSLLSPLFHHGTNGDTHITVAALAGDNLWV